MELTGSNRDAHVIGEELQPGKSNYFRGRDPAQWRTNVPTYGRVRYRQVYAGIDLVYYGNQRRLEYDFVVAPGADPKAIRLAFQGAERLFVDPDGNLVLKLQDGHLTLHRPVAYQEINGSRHTVNSAFEMLAANGVGFSLGPYDQSRPLIVDPVIGYSSYLGGGSDETPYAIAVDSAGNAYVTGLTYSASFPTTAGAFQETGIGADAFVTKLNASGSGLVYSTYISGSHIEWGTGIAVDPSGNAFVAGKTFSSDFPTTVGAYEKRRCPAAVMHL